MKVKLGDQGPSRRLGGEESGPQLERDPVRLPLSFSNSIVLSHPMTALKQKWKQF